jgi:hypothetical protein
VVAMIEKKKTSHTCAMLEMARGHSEGCKALRTNTRTSMSAEHGARSGGGDVDDKSQTAAVIAPQGGDVYRSFCWINNRLVRRKGKKQRLKKKAPEQV